MSRLCRPRERACKNPAIAASPHNSPAKRQPHQTGIWRQKLLSTITFLALELFCQRDDADEIQHAISQSEVNKHIDALIKKADQHQNENRIGANQTRANGSVEDGRTPEHSVKARGKKQGYKDSQSQKKCAHDMFPLSSTQRISG